MKQQISAAPVASIKKATSTNSTSLRYSRLAYAIGVAAACACPLAF